MCDTPESLQYQVPNHALTATGGTGHPQDAGPLHRGLPRDAETQQFQKGLKVFPSHVAFQAVFQHIEEIAFLSRHRSVVPLGNGETAISTPRVFLADETSKTKTTGDPSVNLFDEAAAEYLAGESPEARISTPRMFLPRTEAFSEIVYQPDTIAPAPVTKPKVVPVAAIVPVNQPAIQTKTKTAPVTKSVTEPLVPTPEETAAPPKTVTQPLKNRRRPRSPSDAPQDRVDATQRSDRAAHPRVMAHENVVRRSVNLETGKEEIEVLDAGDLAVERFLKRPARNRTVQSGNVTITTDARDQVSTQRRKRRTKLHPFLRHWR